MDVEIVSYKSMGPVELGMSRQEVRSLFKVPPDVFRQNQFAVSDTDYFISMGIQADYDGDDTCNFVTALQPAKPRYRGQLLLGMPSQEYIRWVRQLDANVQVDAADIISRALGIAAYLRRSDDPTALVECVSIFTEGYYD